MSKRVYTYYSGKPAKSTKAKSYKKSKSKKRKSVKKGRKNKSNFHLFSFLKRTFSFGLFLAIIIGLMVLYNIQYAMIEKDLVEIRQLNKDIRYLESRKTHLMVEIKRLKHVNRIFNLASSQLGLVPSEEQPKILRIDKSILLEAKKRDRLINE